MKRRIKAIIFDQDGLMFDTERMSAEAWEKAGSELGISIPESFLCTIRGMNYADSSKRFEAVFGVAAFDYKELRRRKNEYFMTMMKERELPVKPGLHALLAYIKEQGYKIALATASTREYSLENLDRAGIREYFPYMVTGDMVKHAKPNPEIFLKAAEILDTEPQFCMVLEDSLNGVEAGLSGGFVTVMVPDLTQPDEVLRRRVHQVWDSLVEGKGWMEREVERYE